MNTSPVFEVEETGGSVVVTACREMDEFNFDEMVDGAMQAFELLGRAKAENVVVDFHNVSVCHSTALGFFVKLANSVREAGGRMAFCNVSEHIQTSMRALNLDRVWAICDSRGDAIAEVEE